MDRKGRTSVRNAKGKDKRKNRTSFLRLRSFHVSKSKTKKELRRTRSPSSRREREQQKRDLDSPSPGRGIDTPVPRTISISRRNPSNRHPIRATVRSIVAEAPRVAWISPFDPHVPPPRSVAFQTMDRVPTHPRGGRGIHSICCLFLFLFSLFRRSSVRSRS